MEQLQLRVHGMTCVMCVKTIEKTLETFPHIENVSVDLNTGKVIINGDIEKLSASAIAESIRSSGYEPDISGFSVTLTTSVADEKTEAIKSVPGILSVVIRRSDDTESLEIQYLTAAIDEDELIERLTKLEIAIDTDEISSNDGVSRKIKSFLPEIITGAGGGIVLFLIMHLNSVPHGQKAWLSFFIASPIFVYISRDIFRAAFNSLRHWVLNMDVMYALGMGIAFGASLLSTFSVINAHFMLYETAVFLATFLLIGRHLEKRASGKTSEAIEKLIGLQPKTANLINREKAPVIYFSKGQNAPLSMQILEQFRQLFPEWANGVQVNDASQQTAAIQIGDHTFDIPHPEALDEQSAKIVDAYWTSLSILEVPLRSLSRNNWIRVLPGQQIPVDGVVLWGQSHVDEAMITGEPMAVSKKRGARVFGGCVNAEGVLIINVEATGKQSVLGQIIRMVENAQGQKAPVQKIADKAVSWFIPLILSIAFTAFLLWFFVFGAAFNFALTILISILVIACPCALGLATPAAITVGLGRGANLGIFFKGGDIFERMINIDTILFDKTGTITEGKPRVSRIIAAKGVDEDEILTLAASVEQYSLHPLAKTVTQHAKEQQQDIWPVNNFKQIDGNGVSGELFSEEIRVGKTAWVEAGLDSPLGYEYKAILSAAEEQGSTVFSVSKGGQFKGSFILSDAIKNGAGHIISSFKAKGIHPVMLTGDAAKTAQAVADAVGIESVYAGLMPGGKVEKISELRSKGHRVVFVGDGTNDAPSLAIADVGMAMSSGTDIAIEAGDIVLMRDDFALVSGALQLGRRVMRQIKMNLFWAFFYNLILIPLAAGLLYPFTGWLVKPEFAGMAMAMSSVSVVTFSLLLKRFKPEM